MKLNRRGQGARFSLLQIILAVAFLLALIIIITIKWGPQGLELLKALPKRFLR
jgi:hypothetical protein